MNHVYRSIWNEVTRSFVAAAEVVKAGGRRVSGSRAARRAGSVAPSPTVMQAPPGMTLRPLALEARLMFDAAAASAVVDAAHSEPAAAPEVNHAAALAEAANRWAESPARSTAVPAGDTEPASAAPVSVVSAIPLRSGDAAALGGRQEIAFVLDDVADWQSLAQSLPAGVEVVLLDSRDDALQQMADYLGQRSAGSVDAIHLLSHGSDGQVRLGALTLDNATLAQHADTLARIGTVLTDSGDLLLYGCDVARGAQGLQLMGSLAQATGADVSASADATGAALLGGNWTLEATSGQRETTVLSIDSYQRLLATPVDGITQFGSSNLYYGGSGVDASGSGYLVSDIAGSGWDFRVFASDNTTDVTVNVEAFTGESHLAYGATQTGGTHLSAIELSSNDSQLFTLRSVDLTVDGINGASTGSITVQVVGYLNGSAVSGAVISQSLNNASDNGTVLVTVDVSSNAAFAGIDAFRVLPTGGDFINGAIGVDNINATNFHASNSTPALSNLNGDSVSWAGIGSTVTLDAGSALTLADSELGALNGGLGNWSGASLTVQRSGTAISSDTFGFNTSGALFTVSGSNLQSGGQTFATYTETGGVLTITATSSETSATTALMQDVASRITYRNDTPSGDATVRFTLSDGSASTTADVTVTSNTVYVTNSTDTATADLSDGVSLSEAVAIANSQAGTQTLVLGSALANGTVTLAGDLAVSDSVVIDADAASGLTVAGSTVTMGTGTTLTLNSGTGDTLTVSSTLAGDASTALSKTGAGTLTLSGGNTRTGTTSITGGTLSVNTDTQFDAGTGTVSLNGGTLQVLSSGNTTFNNAISIGSSGGTISTAATGSQSVTFSGAFSSSSGVNLAKTGAGNLQLTGATNSTTMLGGINVTAGGLLFGNGATDAMLANGTITLDGGTLTTASLTGLNLNNAIVLGAGGGSVSIIGSTNSNTLSGVISGSGALTKTSGGTLTLSGVNTYTGTTTVSAGTLSLSGGSAVSDSSAVTVASGATLNLGSSETVGSLAGAGSVTLGSNTLTAGGDNSSTTFSGVMSGTGRLEKAGTGTLTLSGTNTYSGYTTISAGTLSAAADSNLGTGAVRVAGTLRLTGNTTIDNAITLGNNGGGTIEVGTGLAVTLSGVIDGANSSSTNGLIKTGAGTLTLSGTNTYTNLTTVTAGTLSISRDANLGSGALSLDGSTLALTGATTIDNAITLGSSGGTVNIGAATTVTGVISGSGALTKTGSATLTLTGTNTYTGGTTVSSGTLQIGSQGTTGSVVGDITDNATLTFARSDAITFSGVISGTGVVIKRGLGSLTLTGTNTHSGGTNVLVGTLAVSSAASLGSGSLTMGGGTLAISGDNTVANGVAMSSNGTFEMEGTNVFSGVISGTGTMTKTGVGTMTLSGTNTATGNVTLSAGTLVLDGGSAYYDTGRITVSSGATLRLNSAETVGSVSGAGDLVLGADIALIGSSGSTFSGTVSGTGGMTFNNTGLSTLSGNNTYSGTTIVERGGLTVSHNNALGSAASGTIVRSTGGVLIADGMTVAEAFTLSGGSSNGAIQGTGDATVSGGITLTANSAISVSSGKTLTVSGAIDGNYTLSKISTGTLRLSGDSSGWSGAVTVSAGTLEAAHNQALGDAVGATTVANGATLRLADGVTLADNLTVSGSGVSSAGALSIASGTATHTGSITLAANTTLEASDSDSRLTLTGAIGGGYNLTKTGSGTVTLSGTNTYSGSTTVSAGTLEVAADANLGDAGALTLSGGTLATTADMTSARAVSLSTSGTVSTATGTTLTLSGVVSGAGAQLIKAGVGTLALSGTNTYTGGTTVSAGTLQVAADDNLGGSGSLTLSGGTLDTTADMTSARSVVLSTSGTMNTATGTTLTLSGVLSGAGAQLIKAGAGTLALSGTNTYTGGTTVSAGTLQIASASHLGAGGLTLSGGTLANTASVTYSGGVTLSANSAVNPSTGQVLTLSGVVSGTGSLNMAGAGTLVLAQNNTYAGGTILSGGLLQISDDGNLGDSSGGLTVGDGALAVVNNITSARTVSVTGSGAINIDPNLTLTLTGDVSGSGAYAKIGDGTLVLAGADTHSGGTSVSGGTLQVGNGGTTGSLAGDVSVDTALVFNRSDAVTFSGVLSGQGSLTQAGSGTLTLSGANTYSGSTTVTAGALMVNGTLDGTSDVTVASGATLGGTGSVFATSATNTVTVANGGTLAPGVSGSNGGVGALTINGDLTLQAGATLAVDIAGATAGSGHDQVVVLGTATVNGATLSATHTVTPGNGDAYAVLTNDGGDSIVGTFTSVSEGSTVTATGNSTPLTVSYLGGTGNDLTLRAPYDVPATLGNLDTDSVAWAGVGNAVQLDAGSAVSLADTEFDALNSGTGNWSGASLTVQRSGTAIGSDTFGFNTTGALFTVSGNNLQSGGQTFATFTQSGGVLTITATSSDTAATTALMQDVAGRITYRNDTPAGDATVRFSLSDGVSTTTADVTVTSDTICVTNTTDTSTQDLSDGVSLSEAVALANSQTGTQTLLLSSALAGQSITLAGDVTVTQSLAIDADAASGVTLAGSTVTLDGGTSLSFSNGSGDTATIASQVAGSGALLKSGSGTLTLTSTGNALGTNTLSLTGGVLSVAGDTTLVGGNVSLNGGTLTLTTAATIDNAIAIGSNGGTMTHASDVTLSGLLSGSGTLLKTGAGRLTLTNTGNEAAMSGGISVTAGTLLVSDDNALSSGTITLDGGTLSNNATMFTIDNAMALGASGGTISGTGASRTLTLSGVISGTGQLTKSGAASVVLSGSNTYQGGTVINGTNGLTVTDGSNLGSGAVTIAPASTSKLVITGAGTIANDIVLASGSGDFATIDNANAVTLSGVLSNSGLLTKTGAGNLTLSGANTNTGAITVSAGTLTGSTSSLVSHLVNDAAVVFSQSTNGTYSQVISGTGTVTKAGSGEVTFSGANTYTGATTVSAGGLTLSGGSAVADTSAVAVNTGATLSLSASETLGSLSGSGNVALGSHTLTAGGDSSSTSFSGVISGTGGFTKAGSGTLELSGSNTYTGATTLSAGELQLSANGGTLADSSAVSVASGATLQLYLESDIIGSLAGAGTVTLNGGTLTVGGDNTSTTFSGVLQDGANTGNLSKAGSGTLTLSGTNTYSGTTTVSAGTLAIGSDANLGSDAVTLDGGTLSVTGDTTVDNAITLGSNDGTVTTSNTVTLSGVVSGTGNLSKAGSGTLTLSGTNTYSGATTVSAGTVSITNHTNLGSGTLTLDGGTFSFTGSGSTFVDGLVNADSALNRMDVLSNAVVIGAGGGTFTSNSTQMVLGGALTGAGTLTKAGTKTLNLMDANGFTGDILLSSGKLEAYGTSGFGSGALTLADGTTLYVSGSTRGITNNILLTGNATLALDSARYLMSDGAVITFSGAITESGGARSLTLRADDATNHNAIVLSGANTYTGSTTINADTHVSVSAANNLGAGTALSLGAGATLGITATTTLAQNVALSGAATVDVGNAAAATLSGVLSGGDDLTKSGAGTLTLSGTNTYSGTTLVSAGTLAIGSDANLGSGTVTLNGGTLDVTGATTIDNTIALGSNNGTVTTSNAVTLSGVVSGTGDLSKTGSGTLTLSGTNTYSGTTSVSAGTLAIGSDANLGGGAVTLNGGTLSVTSDTTVDNALTLGSNAGTVTTASAVTLSGAIGGSGSFSKAGTGTLTLSGTNTYSGATTVTAGTLLVTGSLAGTTGVSVQSGAALTGTGSVGTVATSGAVTVASGATVAPGVGGVGSLTLNDGLQLGAGSQYAAEVAGSTAGVGHDQLDVHGSVQLNGGTLSLNLTGLIAAKGATYILVNNDGSDAVTGAFAGLAEGATVAAPDGRLLQISYVAGDGNDIGLQALNEAPVAAGITNQTATEDSAFSFVVPSNAFTDVDAGDTLTLSATLSNGDPLPSWLSFNPATRTFSGTPLNSDVAVITVRMTATDDSSTSASSDFTLTVSNTNDAPTTTGIANQTATEDSGFSFTVPNGTFSDVDAGDSLTYSATLANGDALPSWLSFDADTRTFSGTPTNGDVGAISVRVTATDGGSASISSDFTLTVSNTNDAPTATGITNQSATEDSSFSFTVPGGAFSDADVGDSLTFSATLANGDALPSWLSFDANTSTFSGTPANGDIGAISVRVTATDGSSASISSDFTLTVGNTNDAPTTTGIANQTATEDSGFSFTVPGGAFSDVDAGDSLTFTVTLANGDALPSWLSFDADTRTFSGTPRNGDVGAISVSVTATDASSASISSDFTLTVANTNDAPTTTSIANQTATEDSSFSFTVPGGAFSDADVGDSLTYSATLANGDALPSWLSFDADTRTFSGTPRNGDVGAISVRVTATDGGSASISSDFTLTVSNTNDAPTATGITNQSATEDSSFSFTVPGGAFSDADVGDSLTFSATLANGDALPSWLSFDADTRTFSGTPRNGDVGAISVRVTATDASSASISSDFTLTVSNTNDAPTTTGIANQTATEDSGFSFTVPGGAFSDVDAGDHLTLTATLANGDALPSWLSFDADTRTFSGTPANGDVGAISVRVTATDASSASISSDFTLTVANTNDAPTTTSIADQTATPSSGFAFTVPGGTFADVDAGDHLTLTATLANGDALPSWLSFDAETRTFSGTPTGSDAGTIAVRLTATDTHQAAVSSDFTLTVTASAPVVPTPVVPPAAPLPVTNAAPAPAPAITSDAGSSTAVVVPISTGGFVRNNPGLTQLGGSGGDTGHSGSGDQPVQGLGLGLGTSSTVGGSGDAGRSSGSGSSPFVERSNSNNSNNSNSNSSNSSSNNNSSSSNASAPLVALPDLGTASVTSGSAMQFALPRETFRSSDPDAVLSLQVRLANGAPLPSWLKFDPVTGTLSGQAPAGFKGVLQVQITARDSRGHSATTHLEVEVGAAERSEQQAPEAAPRPANGAGLPMPRLAARPGLSEQLRGAGARGSSGVAERLAAAARPGMNPGVRG